VLIVDDDERNLLAAAEALSELGHDLVTAKSGPEALRKLLEEEEFAVILLDLHMPGMDGYETAELIRTRKRTRDVPIVFVTAVFRDEAHIFQAYSAGAVDVVFKPVDPFILRSKVQVLADLHLKRLEVVREAEHSRRLLEENARVNAEKLAAEQALRRTQERQESILRSLPIVFHSRSAEPPYAAQFVSDSIEHLSGFPPSRFVEEAEFGLARVHPEDRDRVAKALADAVNSGAYACEFRWQAADGSYRSFLDQGVLAPETEDGGPREIFGTIIDTTDRRSLESQLAQSQKMEAVGQLTGGVAHDFNNLLTVVLGNVELLAKAAGEDAKAARRLGAVKHAAERGRSLTRQLLAFSRRQHLAPMTLQLERLVEDFAPLMRQAVGEAVTLTTELADTPICVHVDPAQLESALLNLAVNARDAMPEGGALTVSARPARPEDGLGRAHPDAPEGDWAVVEVRDTGAGLLPEVAERIFEPFFTTKEVGKGTGLGLSQVYGFVRQSGGYVTVESQPGQGACFRLFLQISEGATCDRQAVETGGEAPRGEGECILLVEDDEPVLALGVEMLSELGYRVVTAPSGQAALERVKDGAQFDLLFSDIVMPGGLNGLQLAHAVRELRPDARILLTSGYVGELAPVADQGFALIDKPYERAALASRLRELLASAPEAPRAKRRAGARA
jgi:signal transduction histidine kinase